ncbi:MAG: hypothetical protein AB7F88_10350 [Pyrinomonadaceae bacterium]
MLALLASISSLIGCEDGPTTGNTVVSSNANVRNSNRAIEPGMDGAKDNAEELSSLVKLPYEPEDLVWKEFPGAQGRRLVAVFQLTDDDAKKLVDTASKTRPGAPVSIASETWFPTELVTQSEISGDTGIQATSYSAEQFYQSPYNEGTLSRVDKTNFFVLEVFAK